MICFCNSYFYMTWILLSLRTMKLIIISSILVAGLTALCSADNHAKEQGSDSPLLYVVRHIKVELDNVEAFQKAVAEKTLKYNREEGSDPWFTWKVLTGPRSGQYARLFAARSWADLDRVESTHTINIPRANEESEYWRENISPLQETKMPATKVMAIVPGTSFSNIEGDNPTRYGALYKWKMKPGMYQRKTAAAKMRTKALAASGLKIRGHLMRTESGGDFMTFTQFIGFDSWADFGKLREWGGMGEIFEANHGKGSWKRFLKEWNAIHQEGGETEVEYMEYMSDLSSISITK